MSKKYHVRERQFLNVLPEMRAYVIAVVEALEKDRSVAKIKRKQVRSFLNLPTVTTTLHFTFT
jgi:hypothetical protein